MLPMRGLFHIYCRINPTALVALSLLGAYSAGYCDTDKSWQLKWTPCDKEDSEAIVQRQEDERAEEQRRQQAANQAVKDADEGNKLMLLMRSVLLSGCGNSSHSSGSNLQIVKPANFPVLSAQARQSSKPSYCLPSCSANQTK